jgi:hypothetical protein
MLLHLLTPNGVGTVLQKPLGVVPGTRRWLTLQPIVMAVMR